MWCILLARRRFNEKIALESGNRLPSADGIRYATISGSHANMAARALLKDCEGVPSVDKIPAAWRQAIQDGQEWQVIKKEVVREFPNLIDMICQAGNSLQAVSKAEDEMQLLQKILKSIHGWKGQSGPMWGDISAEVLRSRPKCSASATGIFAFVLKFGGSDKLLEATEAHVRNYGRANRELGEEVWTILSQDIKGFDKHLRWRHMLLKFGYCNDQRALSATDATSMQYHVPRKRLGSLLAFSYRHIYIYK